MVNMTLSLPESVRKEMKNFPEIRWSEVARKAIISRLETLRMAERLVKKSKLSEKDIKAFNNKMKSLATERFLHACNN